MSIRTAAIIILVAAACASVPRFKTSMPVSRAPSLAEGLLLCHEYRLPVPSSRPMELEPYVKCVDQVRELHPGVVDASFDVFHDELHRVFDGSNAWTWTPETASSLESGLRAVMRVQWEGDRVRPRVTGSEKEGAARYFPQSSAQLNAQRWEVMSDPVQLDPGLEKLRAEVTGLAQRDKPREILLPQEDLALLSALCDDFMHLRSETDYLTMLWQDQLDMGRLAGAAAHAEVLAKAREQFVRRLEAARQHLDGLRGRVKQAQKEGRVSGFTCPRENRDAGKY